MIICPGCQHEETTGAVFCSKCGAQLAEARLETQRITTSEARGTFRVPTTPFKQAPPASGPGMSLHLVENGQIVPLVDRNEFTLGRVSEGQPIMPDIDLSPFNAYSHGVSRLHAVLKLQGNKLVVMDLGSSNGTYLNNTRLEPNTEQVVRHGDILSLGKLKLQVLLSGRDS
ncbi:MAG: FHA domain-containing protein [Chloroflexi bacterium]|nr:FHA domain-containing protein [Chloroflexota bacterium]